MVNPMTIKQYAKTGRISSSVDRTKRCNCVNVGFITIDGREDETQFNTEHSILTRSGLNELDELFSSMVDDLMVIVLYV